MNAVIIAGILLDSGAWIDAKDNEGYTPLHSAAQAGPAALPVLQALVKRGAAVNTQASVPVSTTPLHATCMPDSELECLRLLLQHGANVDIRDTLGATALHRACKEGREDAVSLLLAHKADVNARDMYESTPLHFASSYMKRGCLRLLVEHGADEQLRNSSGMSPGDCLAAAER